jgi:site-specific recombinase XerD
VVPLNAIAQEAIRAYLATREDLSPTTPLLVQQGQHAPLSRQGLNSLVGRLMQRVGIEGASVHTLRHYADSRTMPTRTVDSL